MYFVAIDSNRNIIVSRNPSVHLLNPSVPLLKIFDLPHSEFSNAIIHAC